MRLLHTVEFGPLKGFREAVRLSEKKHWWGLFLFAATTAHVLLFFTFSSFKELQECSPPNTVMHTYRER